MHSVHKLIIVSSMWHENMHRYLSASVLRGSKFSESIGKGKNWELWGADNVQGAISVYIFALDGCYCVYYPSIFFFLQQTVFRIAGNITQIFPFTGWIFSHATHLDQSCGSKNNWWFIICDMLLADFGCILYNTRLSWIT